MEQFGVTKYLNLFEFRDSNVLSLINILKTTKTIEYEDAEKLKFNYLNKLKEIEKSDPSIQELKNYLSSRLKKDFDISGIWGDFDKEKLNKDYIYNLKLKYDKNISNKITDAIKEIIISN